MRLTLQMMIENGLIDELANRLTRATEANLLLAAIAFPTGIRPKFAKFDTSMDFWFEICQFIEDGRTNTGFEALFAAAARQFPSNPVFAPFGKNGTTIKPEQPAEAEEPTLPAFLGEHDAFISYSSRDREIVQKLAEALRAQGVMPWLDRWDLPLGQPFVEEIERVLLSVKAVVVCFGAGGYGPWQRAEVDIALDQAMKDSCSVIPVMLPGVSFQSLPPLLKRLNLENLASELEIGAVAQRLSAQIKAN